MTNMQAIKQMSCLVYSTKAMFLCVPHIISISLKYRQYFVHVDLTCPPPQNKIIENETNIKEATFRWDA
jgi:hypothetical protein